VKVRREKEKAKKTRDFPCKNAKFQAFQIAIFFGILMDFMTSLDIFGHTLGTVEWTESYKPPDTKKPKILYRKGRERHQKQAQYLTLTYKLV
jgi:hypothetical protein